VDLACGKRPYSGHGALLRIAGQKRKAIQYIVGNPLFALQRTQHDIRASRPSRAKGVPVVHFPAWQS